MVKRVNIQMLAILSLLMSLAVVGKMYSFMLGDYLRLSFFAVPLLLAGIIGGLPWGIVVAIGADLLYGFVFNSFGYNPIYTISSMFWGIAGGILATFIKKQNHLGWVVLIITVLVTSFLETGNNAIMNLLLYGEETTLAVLGYRVIAIFIKLPIIAVCIKIIYDRVVCHYQKK